MSKRVSIGTKPTQKTTTNADAWVDSREEAKKTEPMKRLTIDVPESLHRMIKSACAMRGTKIADEVREILLQNYGKS